MAFLRLALKIVKRTDSLIVLSAIIVIIVIFLFLKWRSKKKSKKPSFSRALNHAVSSLKDKTPSEIASLMQLHKFKTINVYKAVHIRTDLHNAMIGWLTKHLVKCGFTLYMSKEDLEKYPMWVCPVLVIVPSTKTYLFHNDQSEDRSNCRAFEITGNDLGQVYSDIDNAIALMEGLND